MFNVKIICCGGARARAYKCSFETEGSAIITSGGLLLEKFVRYSLSGSAADAYKLAQRRVTLAQHQLCKTVMAVDAVEMLERARAPVALVTSCINSMTIAVQLFSWRAKHRAARAPLSSSVWRLDL